MYLFVGEKGGRANERRDSSGLNVSTFHERVVVICFLCILLVDAWYTYVCVGGLNILAKDGWKQVAVDVAGCLL